MSLPSCPSSGPAVRTCAPDPVALGLAAGWLLDQWLDVRVFFPVGIILGMAAAIYLVVARYGAADPLPAGRRSTGTTPGGRRSRPRTQKGQR